MDDGETVDPAARRWKLRVAYDGRAFAGWQSQPGGRTVQDTLQLAAASFLAPECPVPVVHGSGRTDAGVHAESQIAHVDLPASLALSADTFRRALNAKLPPTLRVLEAEQVSPRFHARFSPHRKTYRYELDCGEILAPLRVGLAWHIRRPLDADLLHRLLESVQGTHDFRAFAASRGSRVPPPRSTIRTVHAVSMQRRGDAGWDLRFTADGFLYRMARLLTGGLVRCATGRWEPARFQELLHRPGPGLHCSACAPADGLYLESVCYSEASDSG